MKGPFGTPVSGVGEADDNPDGEDGPLSSFFDPVCGVLERDVCAEWLLLRPGSSGGRTGFFCRNGTVRNSIWTIAKDVRIRPAFAGGFLVAQL